MALTANVQLIVTGNQSATQDLGTRSFPFALSLAKALTSGVIADTADRAFTDTRTLAASATEDLDLAGGVLDEIGSAVTFAKVVGIFILAAASNTNNVRVTRPASNGVPFLLAAGDGFDIPPGGCFCLFGPALAGIATVTGGTGDLITVTNSGAGTGVTYSIVIIGRTT